MNTQLTSDCDALPQVAMPFMNTVHCEELELADGLLRSVQAKKTINEISDQINAWYEHTVAHFEREEHHMRECNFPPYPIHKSEHEIALRQFIEVKDAWLLDNDYDALENYIVSIWRPWFENHIATLDFVTAQFFKQHGVTVVL